MSHQQQTTQYEIQSELLSLHNNPDQTNIFAKTMGSGQVSYKLT
jgi:hypothetical protein